MNVKLEEIRFNHDRESATADALNIRKNETQPVTVPEWRQGINIRPEDSPAAYAIRETRGNILTIKAKFTSENSANAKVWVRAVEARSQHRQALGCNPIGALLRAFSLDRPTQAGNVLGEVKQRQIEFNATGETGYEIFELHNVRLWRAGVSVSNTEWRWQFRAKPSDHWADFALTRHRIYTVLEIPKCPWEQQPYEDNTQLPWADALEVACDWASSARDVDEAATLVTRAVNDLGLHGVKYYGTSFYSCPNFNCTQFLDLVRGGFGMGRRMNCSDCATAVSTLANLLGCDLRQLGLGPDQIPTNPIKVIGENQPGQRVFFGHEVAWKGKVVETSALFDACLHVDGDDDPANPASFIPLLPMNIRFATTNEENYRFRLAGPSQNGTPSLILKPDTLTCRKIGASVIGECRQLDERSLQFLKKRYDYPAWSDIPPAKEGFSVDRIFSDGKILPEWRLRRPTEHPMMVDLVKATQSLWLFPADQDVLLRLDVFQWETWQAARTFMLRELGEFHLLQVERLSHPAVGDVSFVEAGDISVLFARAQYVFLVRSAGEKQVRVRQIAVDIDKHLSY
jgi:hypothetical protein